MTGNRLQRTGFAVLLVAYLVYATSTIWRPTPGFSSPLDSWLYDGVELLGAALVLLRSTIVPGERRAWLLAGLGLLSTATGDIVYSTVVGPAGTVPSVADPLYLAFYPFVYVALIMLLRRQSRRLPGAVWLDGVTVALALTTVAAAAVFGPISADTGGPAATVAVGLAYPICDLLLLGVVAVAATVLGRTAGRRWIYLASGFALFAIADSAYLWETATGRYHDGTPINCLWPGAVLLVTRAAVTPAPGCVTDRRERTVLLPPLLCTAAALVVLVGADTLHLPRLAVGLATATVLCVALRLGFTFRELSRLAASHHRQAVTDELTGLANRRALLTALTEELGSRRSLLLFDLDRFKDVNDSLGHHVGDALLSELAIRLGSVVPASALLARLGGDEFAVLLADGSDLTAAQGVAVSVQECLREPFVVGEVSLQVEASIGIAAYPDHGPDAGWLLQRADVAMYSAKQSPLRIAAYRSVDDPHVPDRARGAENRPPALTGN